MWQILEIALIMAYLVYILQQKDIHLYINYHLSLLNSPSKLLSCFSIEPSLRVFPCIIQCCDSSKFILINRFLAKRRRVQKNCSAKLSVNQNNNISPLLLVFTLVQVKSCRPGQRFTLTKWFKPWWWPNSLCHSKEAARFILTNLGLCYMRRLFSAFLPNTF